MNFILTFLSYFFIGLIAGAIFSVQVRQVMDHGVVPIVEETYASIKEQILKSKGLEPTKNVESSVEMPKKNRAIGKTYDELEVFKDEEGYYIVDNSGMVLGISKDEIKEFYEN